MSFWALLQVLVDLILIAGSVGIWIRFQRPPKDDPRLSKGLQLLQSKIAVLEDLSDRTEVQVQQLTCLLEQKVRQIQQEVQHSEKQLLKIEQSMQKSLEVAKIFQDRIPHNEIVERQSTIKYVKAARLAHQGMAVSEIASQVDLSFGEIEMIAQVNKDQLMFCEESLPEWAQASTQPASPSAAAVGALAAKDQEVDSFQESRIDMEAPLSREVPVDLTKAFAVPSADQEALKKLGDAFRQACETATHLQQVTQGFVENNKPAESTEGSNQTIDAAGRVIRPVKFPHIASTKF